MSVTVEGRGPVSILTFRWTDKRNALNPDDAQAIIAAVEQAAATASVLIVTGEGAFCSGGDLPAFASLSAGAKDIAEVRDEVYGHMQAIVRALGACPVPTIAAVDGPAVGLGFDIALACDMRFVGANGWFRQGWASAGLVPGVGGIGLLHRVNPTVVWKLVAEQQKLDGPASEALHLAEAAPDALSAALDRAEQLAALGRPLLEHYVTLTRDVSWPDTGHFELTADIQASLIGSAEFRELAASILGK